MVHAGAREMAELHVGERGKQGVNACFDRQVVVMLSSDKKVYNSSSSRPLPVYSFFFSLHQQQASSDNPTISSFLFPLLSSLPFFKPIDSRSTHIYFTVL
jgi:hypothetical protein